VLSKSFSLDLIVVTLAFMLAPAILFADSSSTKERTVTKLAEGVYEIRHPDAPDGFPQSNTTVIIGERSVLVVDSCLLPSTARQDIAQIRQWTDKPVTFLLNTHWHFDHTLGNATYAAAFSNIQIIAQRETRKTIADFNPGAVTRYPERRERFKKYLETGKGFDGKPLSEADRKDYEESLAGLDGVLAEFKDAHQLPPNVSFDKELNIDLGGREVQLRFLGRGNTAGDAVVYLPQEKILLTGDLVDHPVPYFFGGFPVDQVKTLEALQQFDATIIVPGHGDVMHDFGYVRQELAMLQTVNRAIMAAINDGKNQEDDAVQAARAAIDVDGMKSQFVGTNSEDRLFFEQTFVGLLKASFYQQKAR
jgi:glyoxylase-like metal-dependent hydrolase (beta-lactamase superfamily II)